MLVLSRKRNESIVFHTDHGTITLTVLSLGPQVRLGIDAPESVNIRRGELELVARAAAAGKLDVAERILDAAEGQS